MFANVCRHQMVSFSGKIVSVPALIISADREMDYNNNYDQLLCYNNSCAK